MAQLTHLLSRELKAAGKTSIGVHEVSPGLVLTELLLRDVSAEDVKFLHIIADRPEKVASCFGPQNTINKRQQPLYTLPAYGHDIFQGIYGN